MFRIGWAILQLECIPVGLIQIIMVMIMSLGCAEEQSIALLSSVQYMLHYKDVKLIRPSLKVSSVRALKGCT